MASAPLDLVPQALPSHRIEELISEAQIQKRVREIGEAILRDFPDPTEPLLLVGVLKGAALFLADLIRCIDRPVEFDFVATSKKIRLRNDFQPDENAGRERTLRVVEDRQCRTALFAFGAERGHKHSAIDEGQIHQ